MLGKGGDSYKSMLEGEGDKKVAVSEGKLVLGQTFHGCGTLERIWYS